MRTVAVVCMFLSLVGLTEAAQVTASLAPQNARIGDELSLEIKVSGASSAAIQFPFPDQADFTLLKIDSSQFASNRALRYTLAVYDTGRFVLDELPVVIAAETLYTPQLGVTIQSVLPDTASAVLPIKPYREHPFRWQDLWRDVRRSPWTWAALGALLILLGVWVFSRYFRKQTVEELAAPIVLLPPDEQAVRELIALRDKKYPARGMLREFFSEYTHIMREYLERRYEFPALEMTTFDLERDLRTEAFPSVLDQKLMPTFHEADLVKFAKYVPPLERCNDMIETGFEIVALTKPVELSEPASKAA